MMKTWPFAKVSRLTADQRRLLFWACGLLAVASAAIAFLPFRIAIRFGCAPLGKKRQGSVEDCVWAVEAASRRMPWRTVCIEKGLVAQRLLRTAGVNAVLHYGARHLPATGRLEAHVWVMVGGDAVIGGTEAREFAEIATYP
jgi:hypothetical protein